METRALTRSENVVSAGVHGGEGEELLSCLLSFNIEPHVVFVPKRRVSFCVVTGFIPF